MKSNSQTIRSDHQMYLNGKTRLLLLIQLKCLQCMAKFVIDNWCCMSSKSVDCYMKKKHVLVELLEC